MIGQAPPRACGHHFRRGVTAAVVAGLLVSCAPRPGAVVDAPAGDAAAATAEIPDAAQTPAGTAPGLPDRESIEAVLDAVADAFLAGDPERLRPWLSNPSSAFGERWLRRATNLATVPLASYELEIDPSVPPLTTEDVRRRYGPDVRVLSVEERHAIEGHDEAGPLVEYLFLTFVRDDDRWQIAADTDAEQLGLTSADHLWDHGPVVATRAEGSLALHHPGDEANARALLGEAARAREEMATGWPLDWDPAVPIILPGDEDELAELLHVTFDVSNFVAFATSTSDSEYGDFKLTGTRIVVNPDRLLDRGTDVRERILAHELLHVATRAYTGPFVPSWLEEGAAQRLGEGRSTTGTNLLAALGGGFDGILPRDDEFTTGGRNRIFLSYQLGWSFADHLVDRYGTERFAAFYAALGRGGVGQPGRQEWHLDRAARAVYDTSFEELRAEWADEFPGG